jgi:homocysteine S-methyltransferase
MSFHKFFQDEAFVLFDGAIGTQIYAKGIPKGHCYDELNISMPEVVMEVHQEYIQAGAKVVTTNTFGANRFILDEYYDLGSKTREINYYGARLAKRVAKNRAYVAGSVGPVSRPLDTEKKLAEGETREILKEQIEALLDGGVDLLIFETFASLDELLLGVNIAKDIQKDIFIIAQMSFPSNGLTLFGKNPYEVSLKLSSTDVDVIGSNCGTGPQSVTEAVKKMGAVSKKDLSAMPNAGQAQFLRGKFFYPFNPEYFAKYGKKLLEAGVKVLGGCCGTSPSYIKTLHQNLQGATPRKRKIKAMEIVERKDVRKKEQIDSKLKGLLKKGGIIALEVDPPRDADFNRFLHKVKPYAKYIDVINVSDSPMARPRMSPVSTGKLLKDALDKEIIIHYTCRDRNILGIQADILGASALGLDNFLALGGDPPSIGDYPFATGVYDLTSDGLVEMLSALNHGVDLLGNPMGKQTQFLIGVGLGIGQEEKKELEIARFKIKKGAHFVVTQPVFDVKKTQNVLKTLKTEGIFVLASVLPLTSYKNAEYIHYEVPGIHIPKALLARMEGKKGQEGEKEGIRIAKEIIEQLRSFSDGILLMPPLHKYYLLQALLS